MSNVTQFPTRVQVRVTHPSPEGMAVDLRFEMRRKNAFDYIVFLDKQGLAEVSGEELLRAFDEERSAFLMDYVDPRIGFTGHVTGSVLQPQDVENALKAFSMFHGHLAYPEGYEQKLRDALDRSRGAGECAVELAVI
jgi:hypothetical protein